MKNKLKFLVKNKQSFIALFILLVMVLNACENPVTGTPKKPNITDFTPTYFYVDSDGNFTETDSGKTVFVADDKAEVVFYSDNIESGDDDRVGLTFEDKTIIFFFEKDQDFPNRIVLSNSEGSYNGIFTPYDSETQTYSLTLEQGDEKETLSNVALSNDIFTQYKDDPELTSSQNLRIRNLYIVMCIYKSVNDFIASDDTLQARGAWSNFWNGVNEYFSSPGAQVALGVCEIIGGAIAVGHSFVLAATGVGTPASFGELLLGYVAICDGIARIDRVLSAVTGISLTPTINLVVGGTVTLTATIIPSDAKNKSVDWNSDDPRIVELYRDGLVCTIFGLQEGPAKIIVTARDTTNGVKTATCTVTVNPIQTPIAEDFNIGNLIQTVGSVTAVTITPKQDKSSGKITIYYDNSTTLPKTVGTYIVTFDVAATTSWNAASGLVAGKLTISQTPVAADYNIGNLTQTAGSVTAVTITPKQGKSSGALTVYYNGSSTIPQTVGTYSVTFNVAVSSDWNAANGLSAGTLTINAATPVASDFIIGNLTQTTSSVSAVTITPKEGKSTGAITIYYNGSTKLPTAVATYPITFDVAAANGWNAANGLSAGQLIINKATPVIDDYIIGNLTQKAGSVTAVTIKPRSGKSSGKITVYYNGSTTIPQTEGTYHVIFYVEEATGWNAANNLSAGYLIIGSRDKETPTENDYNISGTGTFTFDGSIKTVTVTAKSGKSTGEVTVKYNGSISEPFDAGEYFVTFDVEAVTSWNAASGLNAGQLIINKATPVIDDYIIGNLTQQEGSFTAVPITPKSGKSTGPLTIFYNGSPTIPTQMTAGASYSITFNVAAVTNWNAATLSAGTLMITAPNFTSIAAFEAWLSAKPFNTASTAYTAKLNLSNLGGIGDLLRASSSKYVNLDLSGSSITNIEDEAFRGCTSLVSVTIPNGFTSIGAKVFEGCTRLYSINVDSGNTNYISENGVLYNKNKTSLIVYPTGKAGAFTIPGSVTSIGRSAFDSCSSLTSLTISNSVTSIGEKAFDGCASLTSVTFQRANTTIDYDNSFPGGSSLRSTYTAGGPGTYIRLTGGSTWVRQYYSGEHVYFDSIADLGTWLSIQPNVDKTNPYIVGLNINNLGGSYDTSGSLGYVLQANANYDKYVSIVYLGNTITSIGERAFCGCFNLTSVNIPNNVTSIGSGAFGGCTNLTSVNIPNSVISIGSGAFQDCTNLTSVNIPDSVISIGGGAFGGCTGLTNVNIGNNVAYIESYAFSGCSKLTSLTIGRGTANIRIEDRAFYECTRLTSLIIGQRVTFIGNYAFIGSDLSRVEFDGEIPSGSICTEPFPGDLREKYLAGGRGTYTIKNSWTWTKQ